MHLTVSTQAAGVLEGLATLLTHIRPLASVLPQVVLVVRTPFECERAMRALEGPYACVYPLVDREQRGPLEALSTLSAAVGPFPSMIPHVVFKP